MKILLLSLIAVVMWSIESLGAVQGNVTMKINPSRAQVNLGEYQLRQGQRVGVFKQTCSGSRLPNCKLERVGTGTVSRILNNQYAEVTMDKGVRFQQGYIIRRE